MQRSRLRKLKKNGREGERARVRHDRRRCCGVHRLPRPSWRPCQGCTRRGARRHEWRRAGGSHRHRAEAHREPAGRAGQHHGARHREARAAERAELRRLREVPAERLLPEHGGPGFRASLHARRRQRRQRQPLRPAAERRRVPRRAADHDHPGRTRHPHLRHRARRGAGRSAGHAVRRQLRGRHDAHHHQQARHAAASRPVTTWRATWCRGQGGYVAEGFVNIPLSSTAAIRLVGWAQRTRRLHRQHSRARSATQALGACPTSARPRRAARPRRYRRSSASTRSRPTAAVPR